MYPRNAASPERLAVGAVVAIADGAVQTSAVSIAVIPQGGASSAGGGTTTYDNGIVFYVPTQAETNYSSFIVTAYKATCIPVSITVVTSKSDTTGYAGLDWGQVLNKTTTNALTGTTIASTQKVDLETIKTNPVVNAGTVTFPTTATLASTTNITSATGITVSTNSDKTGYSLSQTFPTNFSAMAITAGGAVTAGTVSDKTGYSLTQSFPTNFSSMAITVGGAVTAGTVSDKTGYSLTAVTGLGNQTADITGNLSGNVGSVTGLTAANLDVAVSTRLATAGYTAPLDAAGTRTAIGLASANLDTQLTTIDDFLDTEVAAIKAKTDLIPATPASTTNITSASGITLATGGVGTGDIDATALNEIADAILDRVLSAGTDSGLDTTAARTVRQALRALRNRVAISAGTMTVYKENDSTQSWTSAITTTAGNPVSESNPT